MIFDFVEFVRRHGGSAYWGSVEDHQRRRSEEDKSKMREFFKENDVISGEIQSINQHDQTIFIQTRNLKYGKLYNGFLHQVNHKLIERKKNHYLQFGSDI